MRKRDCHHQSSDALALRILEGCDHPLAQAMLGYHQCRRLTILGYYARIYNEGHSTLSPGMLHE